MHETTADNPVQTANAVAQVYARSAFDLASEADGDMVNTLADELGQIVALMREDDDLHRLMTNPAINADRRGPSIEAIFKGQVSDLTYRLLQVLNRKQRLDHLPGVAAAYDQILKAERGEVDVDVYAATTLDAQQIDRIGQRIGQIIGRKALVRPHVEESMIGGLKLRVGDQLIDASVATQLRKLKQNMLESGREAVRSASGTLLEDD